MQNKKLSRRDGKQGIGSPLIVGKLDLEHVGRVGFNDRSNLAAKKAMSRQILGQSDNVEKLERRFHNLIITQNN